MSGVAPAPGVATTEVPPSLARSARMRTAARIVALLAVLACVAVVLGPTMRAQFWVEDDHDVVRMLGPDHRITAGELPGVLARWVPETVGRFRPGYYTLRVLEAFAFGDRPWAYHALRLLLAAGVATVVFLTAEGFVGPVAAGVAATLFFAGGHVEIWARMGPAETYAVPLAVCGIAWIAHSARLGRRRPASHATGLLLLLAASLIKENFVALPAGALGIYVLWPLWQRLGLVPPRGETRWRATDFVTVVGLLLGIVFQVAMTLAQIHRFGHVYSGGVTWDQVLTAVHYFGRHLTLEGLWFLTPAVALVVVLATRGERRLRDAARLLACVAAAAVAIVAPQLIFYGSNSFLSPRYLMPAAIFVPACVVIGFHFIRRRPRDKTLAAVYTLVLACAATAVLANGRSIRTEWAAWTRKTRDYHAKFDRIAALKRSHPGLPIVISVDAVGVYEAVVATTDFVDFRLPGKVEGYYLRIVGDDPRAFLGHMHDSLLETLTDLSAHGGDRFIALDKLPPGRCIRVLFVSGKNVPSGELVVDMYDSEPWAANLSGEWEAAEGLTRARDPNPDRKLPMVRRGLAPATSLTVSADADADYVLSLTAAGTVPGQQLTVVVNGQLVREIPLPRPWEYGAYRVPFRLHAGTNVVEIRYAERPPGDQPNPIAAVFRELTIRPRH